VNVLLVEDEARIASFVAKALTRRGHTVDWAVTGRDAIERAQGATRPDVVVLDLGLPDIDGLDVLAALRRHGGGPRVVVVTARTDPTDRSRAEALGIDRYLVKPFSLSELVEVMAG
jgi:two-component system OmpR family response regulator/two-component system response regulator QseB